MITMKKLNKTCVFVTVMGLLLFADTAAAQKHDFVSSLNRQNNWVDSVFRRLNKKQKIVQLFMIRVLSNESPALSDSIARLIKKERPGGLVFFQGGPQRQAVLTNRFQKLSKVPLLIAIDGEWGLGMRLDSTVSYPFQLTLGAVQNNTLIYQMGQQIAHDLTRLGIQMNFAPVMDVNNNPNNPVIGYRSFGDNKYNVAQKAIAYMQGMQSEGIIATAKHFPGHGDTDVDSHLDLPQLPFTRARLDSLEEYPFRQAIKANIAAVMVAHMHIPALDATLHLPSTLSKPIVTGVLKDSLGFKGLVVSDAMGMQGVVKYFPNGEADVQALIAGNDVLELSQNSKRAVKMVKRAMRKGQINKDELYARVKKVLAAKYWAGLNHPAEVSTQNLTEYLNRPEAIALVQKLCDAAVTVLKADSGLRINTALSTAIVNIGLNNSTVFCQELSSWLPGAKVFYLPKDAGISRINALNDSLKDYKNIIAGIFDNRLRPASKLDYDSNVKLFVADLAARKSSTIALFANPYTLATLPGIERAQTLLACYQNSDAMQRSAAKVLEGTLIPTGKLPVSVNIFFVYGSGLSVK